MGVEVLLHHEQGRDDRHQDVEGEQRRLQGPVNRLVAPPGADRHPSGRAGILSVDPLATAPRHGRPTSTCRPEPRPSTTLRGRLPLIFGLVQGILVGPHESIVRPRQPLAHPRDRSARVSDVATGPLNLVPLLGLPRIAANYPALLSRRRSRVRVPWLPLRYGGIQYA